MFLKNNNLLIFAGKLYPTGQNLGRVFDSRLGHPCVGFTTFVTAKRPSLKLKACPKKPFGVLPLSLPLPIDFDLDIIASLNHLNTNTSLYSYLNYKTSHIWHLWRKTTALSCHRCLINTGFEKIEQYLNIDENLNHQWHVL